MKRIPCLCAAATLALAASGAAPEAKIHLDLGKKGHDVPKTLYGIFFEDINFAADGGIYPELVANRGFDWEGENKLAWLNCDQHGWENDFRGDAQARVTFESEKPLHPATARHVRIEAFGAGQGRGAGLRNRGYHGMYVEKGKRYDLSFYARGLDGYKGGIRVVLENGDKVLAECRVANGDMNIGKPRGSGFFPEIPDWKRYEAVFEPTETTKGATLSILLDSPGIVEFEMVSLFPQDTFNGRKNGLRKDLVQKLKDLRPAIMRFPGGCVTEGRDWNRWYDWRLSVGDGSLESRKCIWNTWNYWQTFGLGFYEYFCLCEDIGCEPLPVMNGALTCQFDNPNDPAPMESMPYFAQVFLDLIEFANGDVSTKWGGLRAKMGHPRPFNMKYLGIGNENWGMQFLERYEALAKVIREKHPEIRLVSSAGAAPDGPDFDLAWERLTTKLADVIDEHYYRDPGWFRANTRRYDVYPRDAAKPKVYPGEYACHVEGRGNSLYSALCEAGAMTGFERNSDVIEMTSYAPLFGKVNAFQWKPDLIWFDNEKSVATPNYYVQQLFMTNLPGSIVPSREEFAGPGAAVKTEGTLGLQTWHTSAEFKDIVIADGNGRIISSSLPDPAKCERENGGDWRIENGVLKQLRTDNHDTALTLPCGELSDATIMFKARRTGGGEGFIFRFRQKDGKRCWVNFGGWGNSQHALEQIGYPSPMPKHVMDRLEDNRWYDVKVRLQGESVEVWLDGRRIFGEVEICGSEPPSFFHTCGYDAAAGEILVKCVNIAGEDRRLTVDFGRKLPKGNVRVATLAGGRDDENSLENPDKCRPLETVVPFAGGREFRTSLKPYSLTVFRIKK